MVGDSFVPQEPHGVVDDERGEKVTVDVDPRALEALTGCPIRRRHVEKRIFKQSVETINMSSVINNVITCGYSYRKPMRMASETTRAISDME